MGLVGIGSLVPPPADTHANHLAIEDWDGKPAVRLPGDVLQRLESH